MKRNPAHSLVLLLILLGMGACKPDMINPVFDNSSFVKQLWGPENDAGVDVWAAPDGGYIVLGTFGANDSTLVDNAACPGEMDSTLTGGQTDLILIKTDSRGEEEWRKSYGGEFGDQAASLTVLDDGYLLNGTVVLFNNSRDLLLIKTDFAGNKCWSSSIGNHSAVAWENGHSVCKSHSGGLIIVGSENPDLAQASSMNTYIVETDAAGNFLRSSNNNAQPLMDFGVSVLPEDTNYVILGATRFRTKSFPDSPEDTLDRRNFFWLKAHENLEVFEIKYYGTSGNDVPADMVAAPDGNGYFLCGTSFLDGERSQPELFIVRIDKEGIPLWTFPSVQGLSENKETQAVSAYATADGGLVITGTQVGNATQQDQDMMLLKLDQNGEEQWRSTFGGNFSDQAGKICKNCDQIGQGYIFTGTTDMDGIDMITLIKTSTDGQ